LKTKGAPGKPGTPFRLTAEITQLLLRGYTAPYIAEKLFVTSRIIKTHLTHIYRKVGVSGRQELIDCLYQ
jgi:DNA-binding CsgD family transcriptional regulator